MTCILWLVLFLLINNPNKRPRDITLCLVIARQKQLRFMNDSLAGTSQVAEVTNRNFEFKAKNDLG